MDRSPTELALGNESSQLALSLREAIQELHAEISESLLTSFGVDPGHT
jgi:hypothetical protein